MKAKSKKEYIRQWNRHIDDLNLLAVVMSDDWFKDGGSQEFDKIKNELRKMVDLAADSLYVAESVDPDQGLADMDDDLAARGK